MLDVKLFDTKKVFPPYTPSRAEKKRVWFVVDRITAMQNARSVVDKDWETYQIMIDAIWTPYPDERSSSTVPLASSMIELFVAEATKIKTSFNFVPETSKYIANAKAFEHSRKYLRRKNNRDKPINKAEYICSWFGDVPLYVWYESYSKIQSDANVNDETWEITREENTIEKDGIIMKLWDIRQFYIDDQAIEGIEDAWDCAYRQRMSWDKFQNFKSNPLYKNIEYVQPRGYSNDLKSFINKEEAVKQGNYVERRLYWNVEKDCYIELANGIEVREHPLMNTIDWEKALPRVRRWLGNKNYSVYHRGLCEALLMFNSDINNLREMLMDSVRRSNSSVIAIGNGISFSNGGFSFDNKILEFDGKLGADNFQQISWTPPNQAIFNYMEQLYKDISIYIGIDIQNIMGEPDLTAYQTEVKRESSQKRMNVWLYNRDMAYVRLAWLLKDQIQTWFPVKDAEWLYPELEIDWFEIEEWKGENQSKYRKKKGKNMFQATPKLIREWKMRIEAITNTSAPTIGAVDREQQKQFYIDAGVIAQNYWVAKQAGLDLDSVMPIKEALKNLAEKYWCPVQDNAGQDEEVTKGKQEFLAQLMAMKQQPWQPWPTVLPPAQPWQLPPWQEQSLASTSAPQWAQPTPSQPQL
jgi:hypothetical protein